VQALTASSSGLDELLQQARLGVNAALASLIQTHQRSVYSLALRMLGTRDLAEDLAQDVFVQMSDSLKSIESNEHLGFWLRKVTTHKAIDRLRHRARVEMLPLDDHAEIFCNEGEGDPLLQRHLRKLLQDLSPPARAVVVLRYQEDLDPADIAHTLDMPLNTVKSHLKRSLETLRNHYDDPQDIRLEDKCP
jgi:RNA polymerase sigma-70 factor, ECF subfamily